MEEVGLAHLVGTDRFTILTELLDRFAGAGSDLEAQAARDALLDVLDEILPADDEALDSVRLDEDRVVELLEQYLSALIYNRELREFIEALVRLRTQGRSPLSTDWVGPDGRAFIERMLRAVYDQLEEWG